jgi:hypothetical protein
MSKGLADDGRRVLLLAEEEARERGSSVLQPVHVALALTRLDVALADVAAAADRIRTADGTVGVGHAHLPLPWSRRRSRRYRAYVG